jgi:hypothetical protein
VYVIQNGKVNVFITGPDGTAISLKCVKTGESVTSLLSFIDVLTVSKGDKSKLFHKMWCKDTLSSMPEWVICSDNKICFTVKPLSFVPTCMFSHKYHSLSLVPVHRPLK